ncbi:MAG: hypothetical protein KAW12_20915 [Candidatus Aminicenantes bacterium]|nr:hypothetical protein [Candidatus Aminicenantes bacterium]
MNDMLSVKGFYQEGEIKLEKKIAAKKEIPVIVTFLEDIEEDEEPVKRYYFSDLIGKLEWEGDAVAQQRALRDEW